MVGMLREQLELNGFVEYLGYQIVLMAGDPQFGGGLSYDVKISSSAGTGLFNARFGNLESAAAHIALIQRQEAF